MNFVKENQNNPINDSHEILNITYIQNITFCRLIISVLRDRRIHDHDHDHGHDHA
jgi:hypothetical protein